MSIFVAVLVLLGSTFILVASIGIVRFPDLYARIHASTKATSFGTLLLLVGVSVFFADWIVYLKALLIIVFIYLTAPLAAHAISSVFYNRPTNNGPKKT